MMTPCPETVARASGETNRAALGVRTTRTVAPASCNRRTSSGALYAAMPPLTPRTIFMSLAVGCWPFAEPYSQRPTVNGERLLRGLQRRGLLDRRRELPLHLVLLDLFHGHSCGLGVLALHLRVGALDDLFGAL